MMSGGPSGRWVAAGELADYAFCPRSHWYARTRPGTPVPRGSARRISAGESFHAAELTAVRRRAEHGGAYVAAVVLGVALAAATLWWVFLR